MSDLLFGRFSVKISIANKSDRCSRLYFGTGEESPGFAGQDAG